MKKKKETAKKAPSAVGDAAQDVGEEMTPAKPPLKLDGAWKKDFEKRKVGPARHTVLPLVPRRAGFISCEGYPVGGIRQQN